MSAARPTDPKGASRVRPFVAHLAPLLFAALATMACGGKDKKASTTPSNPAAGAGEGSAADGDRPENMNPTGEEIGENGGGGGGATAGGDEGDGGGGGGSGGGQTSGGAGGSGGGGSSGDSTAAGDGEGGDEGDGGGSGSAEAPRPIRPPDADLPPEEAKRQVAAHLKTGRDAIAGQRNDPDTAIQEARAALQVDETSVAAMVLLAHAYYIKGYYDKAEAILDIALKRPDGPKNAQLHFLRGLVYEHTDRAEKSESEYEKALQVQPNYRSALVNLGVVYLRNKRYADAVQVYERLTESLKDTSAVTLTNLASSYRGRSAEAGAQRTGFLNHAEDTYKRAIAADKTYANAWYDLGLLYLDADPFPERGAAGDMDTLKRLNLARGAFAEYRKLPGANLELADEQDTVAKKQYDREEKKREADKRRREKQQKRSGGTQ